MLLEYLLGASTSGSSNKGRSDYMKIIQERERVETVSYYLDYVWADSPSSGFCFPCDEEGNILTEQMQPAALANLENCRDGSYLVIFNGVKKRVNHYTKSRIGLRYCGEEVHLDGFTNTCDCGADYDSNGNLLAPRSQWGEETGEHISDILNLRGDDF